MKITKIGIFVFLGAFNVAASGYSQIPEFDINLDDVLITEVFYEIERQSNYVMFYNNDHIMDKKVSVHIKKGDIHGVMSEILDPFNLNYEVIEDKYVVVKTTEADPITLTGQVVDDEGEPLVGATVLIKGTTSGAITDINGNYKMEIELSDDEVVTLVVSYTGYRDREIRVTAGTPQTIELKTFATQLDEVIVTGYQTLDKGRTTGSFSKLDGNDFSIISEKLSDRLDGRMTGILVSPDGRMEVRGQNTLNEDENWLLANNGVAPNSTQNTVTNEVIRVRPNLTNPLVVVDGFPIEGGLSTINTNDIKSITVLKDGAASSVWGVRAANGVIVVTTKRGEGKLNVSLSSNIGYNLKPDFSKFHLMSPSDMVDYDVELTEKFGDIWTIFQNIKPVPAAAQVILDKNNGEITEQETSDRLNALRAIDNRGDLEDVFFRNGLYQNHSVSIGTGNEKSNTYFSFQFVKDEAAEARNNLTSGILSFKQGYEFTPWLGIDFGYTGTFSEQENNSAWWRYVYGGNSGTTGLGNAGGSIRTYDPLYDSEGNYLDMFSSGNNYGGINQEFVNDLPQSQDYQNWRFNYAQEQNLSDRSIETRRHRVHGQVKFKPFEMITYLMGINVEYGNIDNVDYSHPGSWGVRNTVNAYTILDPDLGILVNNYPREGGVLSSLFTDELNVHLRNQLEFDHLFDSKHRVTFNIGMEHKKADFETLQDLKLGYDEVAGEAALLDLETLMTDTDKRLSFFVGGYVPTNGQKLFFDKWRDIGYFSLFSYTYDDRYAITGSYRVDESNLFGVSSNMRKNKLWSAGMGWTISQESFFDIDKINFLRFRATYGTTGYVDRNGTPNLTARVGIDRIADRANTLTISSPPNITFRPEKTRSINLGVDLSAFSNRLGINLDLYHHRSKDLQSVSVLDNTVGWSTARVNRGVVTNKGLELKLDVNVLNRDNFKWNLGLNLTHNINKVVENKILRTSITTYPYQEEGYPTSALFTLPFDGLDENGQPILLGPEGEALELHSGGHLPVDSWVYSGQLDPKYFGGLNSTLAYKNLSLNTTLIYKIGHKYMMPNAEFLSNPASSSPGQAAVSRWRNPGDESNAVIPTYTKDRNYNRVERLYPMADYFTEDASHIRVRNISLQYRADNIFRSSGLKNVTFSIQLENPLLWTKSDRDYDPEYVDRPVLFTIIRKSRFQNGYAPKTILFGMKVNY